jgi:hypothetical protein
MRDEWKRLQALFLNDSPFTYYVHCFAHRLHLTLVTASREVGDVHEFFTNLNSIVNVASISCKRHDQLQAIYSTHIAHMQDIGELETGKMG